MYSITVVNYNRNGAIMQCVGVVKDTVRSHRQIIKLTYNCHLDEPSEIIANHQK